MTYKLGVIGFAHMHINSLLDSFAAIPGVEWIAAADTIPSVPEIANGQSTRAFNLKRAQEKTGIPRIYEDYRRMLDENRFDIVIFCPENTRHAEVAEAIAAHGAHMLTEKPMSARYDDALRMAKAAKQANVTLMINWPITWSAHARTAWDLVQAGEIGEVFQIKWRGGSLGPLKALTPEEKGAEWWYRKSDGGGALLDYCCYGACVSRWFLGTQADAVTGLGGNFRNQFGDADDNSTLLVRFPQAMGILEATWSTVDHGIPTGPIIYGSSGTIVVQRKGNEGAVRVIKTPGEEGDFAPVKPLPENRDTIAKEFIHHLETGEQPHITLQVPFNLDVQAILEAGQRSIESAKLELVPSAIW